MDIKYIKELVSILEKSKLHKLAIKEKNGGEIVLEKDHPSQPHPKEVISHPVSKKEPVLTPERSGPHKPIVEDLSSKDVSDNEEGSFTLTAPMIGTFYRASEPGAEVFTKEGASVKKGDVLCIIEAMKVMNEIKAPREGVIKKICAEDSSAVEYGQPLFIYE